MKVVLSRGCHGHDGNEKKEKARAYPPTFCPRRFSHNPNQQNSRSSPRLMI